MAVPPGFVITTEACTRYTEKGRKELEQSIAHLEKIMGTRFGDRGNPLLICLGVCAR